MLFYFSWSTQCICVCWVSTHISRAHSAGSRLNRCSTRAIYAHAQCTRTHLQYSNWNSRAFSHVFSVEAFSVCVCVWAECDHAFARCLTHAHTSNAFWQIFGVETSSFIWHFSLDIKNYFSQERMICFPIWITKIEEWNGRSEWLKSRKLKQTVNLVMNVLYWAEVREFCWYCVVYLMWMHAFFISAGLGQ